jgi:hypothetical protein
MNREYTISAGFKIFYGFLAAGLAGFAVYLFNMPRATGPVVLIIPVLFLAASVAILINIIKSKIIVSGDSISRVNIFKTTQLAIADIKGVRVGQKSIFIESKTSAPKITIANYSDYADSDELTAWLKANFTDLNAEEYKDELQEILNDTSLGFTEEERQQQLTKAKTIAIAYSIGGVVVAVAGILKDIEALTLVTLLYPLLGIVIIATSKGLIKLISKKGSPYYHVLIGVEFPSVMLLIKSISDFHILQTANLWLPAILTGVIFGLAIKFADRTHNSIPIGSQIFILVLVGGMFGFGSILKINYYYDQSPETVYRATVLSHSISHGKSTTYYLSLSPWGPQIKESQISVSRHRYYQDSIGSTVSLHVKQGLLNIPWYTVGD